MDKSAVKIYFEKKIFFVRLELIKDFLFSVIDLADKTYLGDELMNPTHRREHFVYCTNEIINNFKEENISIKKSSEFVGKIFDFFCSNYYNLKKTKSTIEDFRKRVKTMFSFGTTKTNVAIEELVYFYTLFDKNIGFKE